LPTRSTDDGEDGEAIADPYATILFSDNRAFTAIFPVYPCEERVPFGMAILPRATHSRPILRRYRMPAAQQQRQPDGMTAGHSRTSPPQPISLRYSLVAHRRESGADSQAGVLIGREKEYSSGFGPVKHWGLGVLGPIGEHREGEMRAVDEG
jgi:hypothetical protein